MTRFTITITPDDEALATTSVRVDASDSAVHITELLIRAGAGGSLSAEQLPAVNLELLLRAVTPAIVVTPVAGAGTPAVEAGVSGVDAAPVKARKRSAGARTGRAVSAEVVTSAGAQEPAVVEAPAVEEPAVVQAPAVEEPALVAPSTAAKRSRRKAPAASAAVGAEKEASSPAVGGTAKQTASPAVSGTTKQVAGAEVAPKETRRSRSTAVATSAQPAPKSKTRGKAKPGAAPAEVAGPAVALSSGEAKATAPRARKTPAKTAAPAPAAAPDTTEAKPKATRKRAERPAPKAAGKPARKTTPAAGAEPATPPADASANGRVYRRMPDDLAEVFAQAGTVTGVADHYDVPRHTAQNWVSRARKQGSITG